MDAVDAEFTCGDRNNAVLRGYALCVKKSAEACLRTARLFDKARISERFGTTSAALRKRGRALLEEQCAGGEAETCYRLGKLLAMGQHVATDLVRAVLLLGRACGARHADACEFLSRLHDEGRGVARDPKRAQEFLERACEAGGDSSCTELGTRLLRKNPTQARRFFDRACAGEDPAGCAGGARMDERREPARALAGFLTACEREYLPSCIDAGRLLAAGKKVVQDSARARVLYGLACDADLGAGCLALATLLANTRKRCRWCAELG